MAKLTKAQRELLGLLADGRRHTIQDSYKPAQALVEHGFATRSRPLHWVNTSWITITDVGRDALARQFGTAVASDKARR